MDAKRSLDSPNSVIGSDQTGAGGSCGQGEGGNKRHVSSRVRNRAKYDEILEKKRKDREQLFSRLLPCGVDNVGVCHLSGARLLNLFCANKALEFYNKIKGNEYELVKPLHSEELDLYPPGSRCIQTWCHVVFTAKLRSDTTGVTEKFFFAEILKEDGSGGFKVQSCSMLEQSDWDGFNHGCVMCPPCLMLHPREFVSGRSGYRVVKWLVK